MEVDEQGWVSDGEGLGTWTGRRVIIPSQTDGEPQNEASLSLRSERQAPELLPQMVWQLP